MQYFQPLLLNLHQLHFVVLKIRQPDNNPACYLLHRKHFKFLSIAFAIAFATSSFSQNSVKNNFTNNEIKAFIIEVFQKNTNQLVYNTNQHRLNLITAFLYEKYVVEYLP